MERRVLDENLQPEVINYEKLVDLVLEQSPQGEAGRIFRQENVKLEEVKELRIEFMNILRLEHLWPMKNIRKLVLAHNAIEKIEKLDDLVKLRELDLSFNKIHSIENMGNLVNLEILILSGNKISEIQGIDELEKLEIFSIAENNINTWDHVMYLRKFKNLKSVNTSGNPCSKIEGYRSYLVAFLPQIIYISYKMISDEEKYEAQENHKLAILRTESQEDNIRRSLIANKLEAEKRKKDEESYVENLDEDIFFLELIENDKEGYILSNINSETSTIFQDFKRNFIEICHELYKLGIEEHEKRNNELKIFNKTVVNAKESVRNEARRTMNKVVDYLNNLIAEFKLTLPKKLITNKEENNSATTENNIEFPFNINDAQKIIEDFEKMLSSTWTKLMYSEVVLHEQIEEVIDLLKLNMTNIINLFVESIRNLFSKMRNADIDYRDEINRVVSLWVANTLSAEGGTIPKDIIELCGDTETLNNNLAASHDSHLQVIDLKEDNMIRKINSWSDEFIQRLVKEEHERNRGKILEISHFLEYQRGELDEILQEYHLNIDKTMETDLAAIFDG